MSVWRAYRESRGPEFWRLVRVCICAGALAVVAGIAVAVVIS